MNRNQYLIIITGHPASGKTTLAKKLEKVLMFPLVYRDQIKEILYDSLGWSDITWSKKLGLASYELLFYTLETHLVVGNSVIIESNFSPDLVNDRISELKSKYNCKVVQIYCYAKPEVLLKRYSKRGKGSKRHPGHFGHEFIDEYKQRLEQFPKIMLDADITIVYDTSTFEKDKENDILEKVLQIVRET